jgi:hypothetical protein
MKTRAEYFESIRKEIDELTDHFSLDKSQWAEHTDLQTYERIELLKGASNGHRRISQ